MVDTGTTELHFEKPEKPVSRDVRTGIATSVITLSIIGIGYLIVWGEGDNSLHASALAWCFFTLLLTMAGLGLVTFAATTIEAFRK